jgi:hypothetical protein
MVNTRNKCIVWQVDTSISEHTACVTHSLKRRTKLLQISQSTRCHSLLHHETCLKYLKSSESLCDLHNRYWSLTFPGFQRKVQVTVPL